MMTGLKLKNRLIQQGLLVISKKESTDTTSKIIKKNL